MSRLPAAACAAVLGIAGLFASAAGARVLVITAPDGSRRIVNVPDDARLAPSVPQGSQSGRSVLWPTVEAMARSQGLDPDLVDLVIRMESGYNPFAISAKGARGVMQLMPQTASLYGVHNVFDARENIRAGVSYLKDLLTRFNSNVGLALAAYNAGPQAVESYGGVPPYHETRSYVRSILGAYRGDAGPVLAGGFGRLAHPARPVRLLSEGSVSLISNAHSSGEATLERRLGLR